MNPIPYMNQKGIMLHDHKTPKDSYYFYKSMYRSAEDSPMVYIVSESWKNRWEKPEAKDIWVYSNCDSVSLYNDFGKIPLGTRVRNAGPRGDTRFQWNKAFVEFNILYAEGWYKNQIVAKDTLILENLPNPK
jgi:beta-galactosidase